MEKIHIGLVIYEDIEFTGILKKLNRIKKTAPKRGLFWCLHCDRGLVAEGGRCPTCGKKDYSTHKKK